jgi:hypothetical protein
VFYCLPLQNIEDYDNIYLPSICSLPIMTAEQFDTFMECANASARRLLLIKATITPILDKPSQMHTYSGQLSMYKATISPRLSPCSLK